MVFTRILRCLTRWKERQNGDRLHKIKFVRQTTGPPLCLRFRDSTNHSSISQILRQDGCSYFQIALDEESSLKTTFLLPSGRYRYLRIPQGLNASSDEWCRRSDTVIDGLPWANKIVDDILVWASSLPELKIRVETIANNCKNLNITLSKKSSKSGDKYNSLATW